VADALLDERHEPKGLQLPDPDFTIPDVSNCASAYALIDESGNATKQGGLGRMFLRAALIAAAIATATVGWAAPPNARSSLAAATLPISPVISADDQCGDGYEWSKTIGACIPVPTRASTPPQGATYQCADGTYSFSKTSKGACSRHGGIDHPV
jgi:hypothetical protein